MLKLQIPTQPFKSFYGRTRRQVFCSDPAVPVNLIKVFKYFFKDSNIDGAPFGSIPIILVCCLLIYLEDGGPFFYKQIRNGQYEKTFEIVKLRTMKVNAEDDGPQWSKIGDKRITKLGKILRLLRIDELPQFLLHPNERPYSPKPRFY